MGFDKMALGIAVLTVIVAMVLVVLTEVQEIDSIDSNTNANATLTSSITAVALYGDFFEIIVLLGIFVGLIGLMYFASRASGGRA